MATISVTLPADGTTADVADYNTPLNTIVNEFNGNIDNANIKTAAAISGSKLADNSIDLEAKASTDTGWREVTDSWTYASATSITVPSDATAKYSVGDKIRLTQSTVKYFYITAVSTTVLTITGGTDYTLANAAISDMSYSKAATPLGFPQYLNWTTTFTNLTTGNGTINYSRFTMIGKLVKARVGVTFGSTSSIGGAVSFTLPVSSVTSYVASVSMLNSGVVILDAGTARVDGAVIWLTSTTAEVQANNAAGVYANYVALNSTTPMTWTTNDALHMDFEYEAA